WNLDSGYPQIEDALDLALFERAHPHHWLDIVQPRGHYERVELADGIGTVLEVENYKIEAAPTEYFDEERIVSLGEHSKDRSVAGEVFSKGGHRLPYH